MNIRYPLRGSLSNTYGPLPENEVHEGGFACRDRLCGQ
mgnify:CR=1 FL=1